MKQKIKSGVNKFYVVITLLSAELLLASFLFFISLAVLIIVIRQIFFDNEYTMDEQVFSYLSHFVTDTNTKIMQFISFFGSYFFLVPAWLIVIAFYYFIRKNKWYFIKLAFISISNLGMMFGLKYFFNRPRPSIPLLKEVPGLSFPSGHAFMSLIFFGMIIYILYHEVKNKWVKWGSISLLVIIIFLVGLSRIYLRVHFASDVIAGFCFGILSLMIQMWLLRRIEKFNAEKIPHQLNITRSEDDLQVY